MSVGEGSAARRQRTRDHEARLHGEIRRLRAGVAGTAAELERRDSSLARDVALGLRSLLAVACEHWQFVAPKGHPERAKCMECGKDPDDAGVLSDRITLVYF